MPILKKLIQAQKRHNKNIKAVNKDIKRRNDILKKELKAMQRFEKTLDKIIDYIKS